MGEGPRLKFEEEDGQTDNKKWQVRAFVTTVVPPRLHARSGDRFEFYAPRRSKPSTPGQVQDQPSPRILDVWQQ